MNLFNNKNEKKFLKLDISSIDSVNDLINKYLEKNTFNNIAILLHLGKILSLDTDTLFEKIEVKDNGGYCFEHNKLFYYGLLASGIASTSHLARVVYGKSIDAPKTHRLSIISLQGKDYLVDVGFGPYTPNKAIPLSGEVINCKNNSFYRVKKSNELYSLEILKEDQYFTLYQFNIKSSTESDFNLSNYYTNTHPDSKFVKGLIISRYTPSRIIFINDLVFSELSDTKRIDRPIESVIDLQKTLKDHFSIKLSGEEAHKIYLHSKGFLSKINIR